MKLRATSIIAAEHSILISITAPARAAASGSEVRSLSCTMLSELILRCLRFDV